ncbi:molybdopterin molybdenumtransferase MoeA [Aliidongia dinghuensis]|uniref:Molybdopterin molybdenumtransferase n=1 Tax=Aliidongia dinghuensis TaxID=1867774 RepID=A0A8J3E6D3_9PROT|nr:gephyrin-like molybdotransferase Glp [Aliidongia dinghuensis]GGF40305.1 molybdopterin molybdenumtransferase MoeA [Aliidongia dinghuensis]
MISVADALARIREGLTPLGAELISLADAYGRVLAEDLTARRTQPPFAVSAMDGYAVRAADVAVLPTRLKLVGYVPAGGRHEGTLGPGEAVRIFTGARLPDGADAVVIQEDTEASDGTVLVHDTVGAFGPGRHVRQAGIDFVEGEVGLKAGRRLSARDVGLAAAMNRPWLMVHRRPRVAILPTGDEVALPGDPIGPNQIVSSNGAALAALIAASGGIPIQLGIARDDGATLKTMARGAEGADLLVTIGGASVGEHDLVKSALGEIGLTVDFWKIAMRPGKPLMFGRLGATAVLGLPGNPVSALVCGMLFLRPALERLQGLPGDGPLPEPALAGAALAANDGRQDYLRARLVRGPDGAWVAMPFEKQDSSMMSALAGADCLIVRPPAAPAVPAGAPVDVIRLSEGAYAL